MPSLLRIVIEVGLEGKFIEKPEAREILKTCKDIVVSNEDALMYRKDFKSALAKLKGKTVKPKVTKKSGRRFKLGSEK